MSRPPPQSAPAQNQTAPAVGAPANLERPVLERAELRMRTLEVAGVFRRENTPVEALLKTADQLFAWVTEEKPPA